MWEIAALSSPTFKDLYAEESCGFTYPFMKLLRYHLLHILFNLLVLVLFDYRLLNRILHLASIPLLPYLLVSD